MLIVFYIEDEDLQGSQRREDNRGQWAGAWGGGGGVTHRHEDDVKFRHSCRESSVTPFKWRRNV